ncbi:MAG TPA: hypothetical protein VG205_10045 [Acidimicrobiales bacterium]|nr:hypothetical protein [Acidimicrobiales bacterium]
MARAASTGGGKTYRGQMPINWYASLVIIVVVGLFLVGFSRYQRTHKVTSGAGSPTTSQTWHAALAIDICGTTEPNLPASTNTAKTGLTANGSGLVIVNPHNSSESGANATLGKFVSGYKGLTLSSTTLGYPGKKVMSNGATCPKGTPDAGKQGYVNVVEWTNYLAKKSTDVQGNPSSLKFGDGQMITMAFVPATASVPKPPGTVVSSLITAVQTGATTSTTAPSTSTTAPTTTTTAPTTATTAPAATTTAPTTATTAAPAS